MRTSELSPLDFFPGVGAELGFSSGWTVTENVMLCSLIEYSKNKTHGLVESEVEQVRFRMRIALLLCFIM